MNSGKILFFFGCLILLVGCSVATEPVDYDDFLKTDGEGEFGIWVQSGFYSRLYTVHTPPGLSESGSYPLLIFLHGAGGTGASMERSIRPHEVTDSAGFITVYPDGMEGSWTVGCQDCTFAAVLDADDVSFLETLTNHLREYLPIDPTRVYLVGHSQGGSLAYLYACTASLPAAGIAVTGSLALRKVIEECLPAEPLSLVVVHGTYDPLAYYSGFGDEAPVTPVVETVSFFAEEMNCEPQPIRTELPDSAGDFTSVTSFRFPGCDDGGGVLHYRVNGGGNSWPGDTGPWGVVFGPHSRNLDTTREILRFFDLIETGG